MRVFLALLAAFALAACGTAPAPAAAPTTTPPAPSTTATATSEPRQTITLAYSDDPSRVALLWAITNKKVTSPFLDVQVSFLPVAQIIPAANTKQYDAIEATPLAVPRTAGGEPGFRIISSGLVNISGTVLLTGKDSAIRTPADLKGRTIAVASLGGTFVQETRYVLTKKYGLNTNLTSGDVKLAETPQESVLQLLKDRRLDAATLTQLFLYRLKDSTDVRVLAEITTEVQEISGQRSVNSIVVTYRDRAQTKAKAMVELQRLLRESRDYLRRNQADVVKAVAAEKRVDEAYLTWFFTAYDLAAGPLSAEDRAQITAAWQAAKDLGDIKEVPKIDEVSFSAP